MEKRYRPSYSVWFGEKMNQCLNVSAAQLRADEYYVYDLNFIRLELKMGNSKWYVELWIVKAIKKVNDVLEINLLILCDVISKRR